MATDDWAGRSTPTTLRDAAIFLEIDHRAVATPGVRQALAQLHDHFQLMTADGVRDPAP